MSEYIKEVPLYFPLKCKNCENEFYGDIDECPECGEGPACLEMIDEKEAKTPKELEMNRDE